MMQEQPLSLVTASPDSMNINKSLFSAHIVEPDASIIEEDLIAEYNIYRSRHKSSSLLQRTTLKINQICASTYSLCHQLWNQIIPEGIRGEGESTKDYRTEISTIKDKAFFQEFNQKKVRFFLIIFDPSCHEEEMQQAYEKSSFMVVEGRGIRIGEFMKQTNCSQWRIKNCNRLKKYCIFFFKIDMFGHLLNFGQLSKQLLDANQQDSHFLQNFKNQLNEAYSEYQKIQKNFINSYLEKEDRNVFE